MLSIKTEYTNDIIYKHIKSIKIISIFIQQMFLFIWLYHSSFIFSSSGLG